MKIKALFKSLISIASATSKLFFIASLPTAIVTDSEAPKLLPSADSIITYRKRDNYLNPTFFKMPAQDKKYQLSENYGIMMTRAIDKEMTGVCNLSQGIMDKGIEKGLAEGTVYTAFLSNHAYHH